MQSAKGNIAPTQTKITELKHSVITAKNASNMLLKKAQVFDMYLKDYVKKLEANIELMDSVMKEAFIELSYARYSSPLDLTNITIESVSSACVRINTHTDRFLGNALFHILYETGSPDIWPMAGLSKGGKAITEAKKTFRKAVEILVGQITLQSVFIALFEAKKLNMRKSMVIDKIVVPQIQELMAYIRNHLDDMERDDNYRYKLVKRRYARKHSKPEVKKDRDEEEGTESYDDDVDNKGKPSSSDFTKDVTGQPSSSDIRKDVTGEPSSSGIRKDVTGEPSSSGIRKDVTGVPLSGDLTKDNILEAKRTDGAVKEKRFPCLGFLGLSRVKKVASEGAIREKAKKVEDGKPSASSQDKDKKEDKKVEEGKPLTCCQVKDQKDEEGKPSTSCQVKDKK